MAAIPADYLDLLQQKTTFAHLATIMPDGTPQVTPVWFDYTNGKIRVNSAKGRVKARNMREGAPVALSILDPDNPYRYIQIRGRVGHVTEEGASAHIDSLAKKYLGKDKYPWAEPGQVRIIFEIEPTAVQAQGSALSYKNVDDRIAVPLKPVRWACKEREAMHLVQIKGAGLVSSQFWSCS